MTHDARFSDADEGPLRLRALDADDLGVISGLVQDAVFPAAEMKWDRRRRRFALLVNRFRWEWPSREAERVRSVLSIEEVTGVASQGIDPRQKGTVLSLLSVGFEPGDDGTGRVVLTLSGDGAIRVEVEALEVLLRDVTRPYVAPSRTRPAHPD